MFIEAVETLAPPSATEALSELGTALVDSGTIDSRMLDRARRVEAETGARLDRVLTSLGLVSERGLAEAMARLLGSPLASAADYPEAPLFPDRLKARFLRAAGAMPIAVSGGHIVLAMTDPFDSFTRNAVAAALSQPVATAVAIPIEFEAAFERLYPESEDSGDTAISLEEVVASTSPFEEDAERLRDLASEEPVIRLVNNMITRAVETRASDIHIEPFADRLRVRYRYDGILHEAESPQARLQAAVISRI